uniref:DRBM domain-containing protein n=1 Tax=Caenorhabditis tropicalis TaxID=1561998 RepID=A0A1I7T8V0_9PELO
MRICDEYSSCESRGNWGRKKKKYAQQEACTKLLKTVEPLKPENNPVLLANTVCKTQKKLAALAREPKRKTIVKDKKMDPLYGHQINPVSRLIQVTQAKTKEHPTFELVAEHGVSKYKEFVIRVKYGDETREGKGPNKRLAKRAAAEAMLETIGIVKPLPPPGKSLLKKIDCSDPTGMPVISHWTGPPVELPIEVKPSEIREPVEPNQKSPSLSDRKREGSPDNEKEELHSTLRFMRVLRQAMENYCFETLCDQNYPNSIVQSLKKDAIVEGSFRKLKRSKENRRTLTSEQMKELYERTSSYLEAISNNTPFPSDFTAHYLLEQLSGLFKFSVQYTSFPELEKNQFTIVSLGLDTPLVCHGFGRTTADAEEQAALDAVTKLKQLASQAVASPVTLTLPLTTIPPATERAS